MDWPQSQPLRSGDLSAIFDRGDIAHLSMRGHELVRLIYVAVRDPSWNTISAVPLSVQLHTGATGFVIHASARATCTSLDLDWHLDIKGFPDGKLEVDFQGRARRDCAFARIGLCLHFDAERFSRAHWTANSDSRPRTGLFPARIHPQYLVDGVLQPCIPAFSTMRIALESGASLDIRFEGDQLEIEDQRNWTDATFKAYTTPLALGELHHLAAGDTIQQRLHVSLHAPARAPEARRPVIDARVLPTTQRRLPELGAARSPTGTPPKHPPPASFAHWRLDVCSATDIEAIVSEIEQIHGGKGIELVLHPGAVPDHRLEALLAAATHAGSLTRLILLGEIERLPAPAQVLATKGIAKKLLHGLAIGAGAPGAYADVARDQNDFSDVDFIAFPISPQSHVFDTQSIFETLSVQEEVVRDARRRTARGEVVVSSLTFGIQAFAAQPDCASAGSSQPATTVAPPAPPGRDRRLQQLGAAWLGASLGHLALGGATSVTLAPDLWMAEDLPAEFTHLLRIFVGLDKAMLRPFDIDDPRRVFLFGASQGDDTLVFLINLTDQRQRVRLTGLSQGSVIELSATRATAPADAPEVRVRPDRDPLMELQPYQLRVLRHLAARR